MSYYGYNFSFDGIPSEQYGLMIYDFGSVTNSSNGFFTSDGTMVGDRIPRRYGGFYYGTQYDSPLEFTLVFGLNQDYTSNGKHLDRWDLETIASWLTGKNGYRWLEIDQPDMETARYRCIITGLGYETSGRFPLAFSCKVQCDSPFAFTYPQIFTYTSNGSLDFNFLNRSTYNGYYYPKLELRLSGAGAISITNYSDSGRVFSFTGLPSGQSMIISVDNENGIITSDLGTNIYPCFNFNFFRFVRGDNLININGHCTAVFTCEFPMNIGGG